jgi:hypothetical protein
LVTAENRLFSLAAAKNKPYFLHLFFDSHVPLKIRKMLLKIAYF